MSAPGRHGATRCTSINAGQTRSSGAATSNDCSSFIADLLQVFRGIDVAPGAYVPHLELRSAVQQAAGSLVAVERAERRNLVRTQHDRVAGAPSVDGAGAGRLVDEQPDDLRRHERGIAQG